MWFWIAFLAAFMAIGLFKSTYMLLPSGDGVVVTKLWVPYLREWPQVFNTTLGPGLHGRYAIVWMTATHVGVSAVVGLASMGVDWWFQKRNPSLSE